MASSKRERELARMRAQRQAERRAAARAERQKRRNAILVGISALAVAGVIVGIALATGGGKGKSAVLAQPTPTATATAPAGACAYTPSRTASKKVTGLPPAGGPLVKGDQTVAFTTNRGEVDLTLHGAKAPCTVNSFTFLTGQKYFDATTCHRLTTAPAGIYVLQCGDPTGTGTGGPGYKFPDENLTALGTPNAQGTVIYPRGTVAMANGGPGTNGSQFFLVYKDTPLGPAYTPFGTITKGLDVLDTVAKAGADSPTGDGHPKLPLKILTVRLVR